MSNRWLFVIWFSIVTLLSVQCSKKDALKVIYEWKYIDYDFDSEETRKAAIESGEYNYTKAVPIDVDRWRNITFVTVIRQKGVPSSLNIVTNKTNPAGPLLKPYPDWSWAKLGNCSGITNAPRVQVDVCGKLWVLDNGKVGLEAVCDPQILVFDLETSQLVKRVKIPKDIATNSTTGKGLLVTPILIQEYPYCDNIEVYIADVEGFGLIVYNNIDDSLKRLTSSAFNYDSKATIYTINGESFTVEDGIVGMAYSDITGRIYYSPMSSFNFNVLNDKAFPRYRGQNVEYKDFLCTQSSVKAASGGIIFFALVGDTSIGCYNEFATLQTIQTDVVAKNSETLQFTSGLKTISNYELWALTNRFQKIATGTINFDEVNFRILKGNIEILISNTCCDREKLADPEQRICGHEVTSIPPPLLWNHTSIQCSPSKYRNDTE